MQISTTKFSPSVRCPCYAFQYPAANRSQAA